MVMRLHYQNSLKVPLSSNNWVICPNNTLPLIYIFSYKWKLKHILLKFWIMDFSVQYNMINANIDMFKLFTEK